MIDLVASSLSKEVSRLYKTCLSSLVKNGKISIPKLIVILSSYSIDKLDPLLIIILENLTSSKFNKVNVSSLVNSFLLWSINFLKGNSWKVKVANIKLIKAVTI